MGEPAGYSIKTYRYLRMAMVAMVVLLNAQQFRRKDANRTAANRYSVIALGMVVVPLVLLAWKALFGWEHAVLWIEGVLITLFATFWLFQTQELWHEGVRTRDQELPLSQAMPSPFLSSSAV